MILKKRKRKKDKEHGIGEWLGFGKRKKQILKKQKKKKNNYKEQYSCWNWVELLNKRIVQSKDKLIDKNILSKNN